MQAFKGFGKEPAIKDVVFSGLKAYKQLQKQIKGDFETEKLLAQVVMKYREQAGESRFSEDADMKFARIKTMAVLETLDKNAEEKYPLQTLLRVALHASDEQIMALES